MTNSESVDNYSSLETSYENMNVSLVLHFIQHSSSTKLQRGKRAQWYCFFTCCKTRKLQKNYTSAQNETSLKHNGWKS